FVPWWARWDGPLLVAAAPIAASGMGLGGAGPVANLTMVAVGAECMAVAVRIRRRPTIALGIGVVGAGLVVAGADRAGPGWLALALLGLAVLLTALSAVTRGVAGSLLRIGGVVSAVAAWRVAIVWLAWPDQRGLDATALVAGAVAVLAAGVSRWSRLDRGWMLAWGGGAVALAAAAGIDATAGSALLASGGSASWFVAGGLVAVAASLLGAAGSTGLTWLRELGVAFLVGALLAGQRVADLPATTLVTVLCLLGAATAVLLLALLEDRFAPWRRPLLILGAAVLGWAAVIAVSGGGVLLAAPLAVAAVHSAAAGVAMRILALQLLSPVLACGAWIVFADESLHGRLDWTIAPIGLAMLAAVGLWRRDLRLRDQPLAPPELVGLELAGVALLVGPSLAQTATVASVHALVALVLGLAITGWGAVTKVRRRVVAGLVVVSVSVLLLVAVPLVMLLPSWQGPLLWAAIAAVGLAAVLAAALVERGKAVGRKVLLGFADATDGWE
ncbi:MAG: hypothetical protein L0H25_09370, partial [Micrococcales bacterium]|nr:hypothetical protein [Micrococcales bacterium]